MSREAMKIALEALERYSGVDQRACNAEEALREALETEQEPVAWANSYDLQKFDMKVRTGPDLNHTVPLYTAPPKRELTCVCGAVWEGETMVHPPREREWVGLTDQELEEMHNEIKVRLMGTYRTEDIYRSIEAKLREKNT